MKKPKGKASLLRRIRNKFLTGLIIALPLTATILLISFVVNFVENIIRPAIPDILNPEYYLGVRIPGLGVFIAILLLFLLGLLAGNLIGRRALSAGERMLGKIPFIRGIYGFAKQVVGTITNQKDKAFKEVCLLEYPRKGCWVIGFVTSDVKGAPQEVLPEGFVCVFVPTTPNPTSGFLLIVERKELKILNMTAEQGAKMIISGGMVTNDSVDADALDLAPLPE